MKEKNFSLVWQEIWLKEFSRRIQLTIIFSSSIIKIPSHYFPDKSHHHILNANFFSSDFSTYVSSITSWVVRESFTSVWRLRRAKDPFLLYAFFDFNGKFLNLRRAKQKYERSGGSSQMRLLFHYKTIKKIWLWHSSVEIIDQVVSSY